MTTINLPTILRQHTGGEKKITASGRTIGTALVVRLDASAQDRPEATQQRRSERREQIEGEFPGGLFVSG